VEQRTVFHPPLWEAARGHSGSALFYGKIHSSTS
jgi:hypothetical protein